MADVRCQKQECAAVYDRMRYVLKPIAVRLENVVTSVIFDLADRRVRVG